MFRKIVAILCVIGLLAASTGFAETTAVANTAVTANAAAQSGGQPPAKPDGSASQGGMAPPDGGTAPGGAPGGSQEVSQGTAAVVIDSDAAISSESYTSANTDENAVRVSGAVTVLMNDVTVEKSGGTENADSCNFYGQNAGLLATDGASVTITGADVHTNGSGANGVFSYGTGTTVNISDSIIQTEMDNSGGILVTGGGTLNADNLTVETQGKSAAAIRSDRGGGTMTVNGGTYTSNGTGSPAIYSTAAITATDATLNATTSEAVVVEGKNSVTLVNCDVTGNMQGTYGQDSSENIHNVMLYQSMSGDADVGRSDFSMTGGSLTAKAGDMFYVTNTNCSIELTGVALTLANENLLTVAGNTSSRGWGQQGSNGGDCVFTADGQTMTGVIAVDSISTLALTMQNGTSFTGTINPDGQAGTVNVTLDGTSTWTLTADAYVTSFTGSMDQVIANGYTLHVAE